MRPPRVGQTLLEEAALCVASLSSAGKPKRPRPQSSTGADAGLLRTVAREGLTLLAANNRSGYFGVCFDPRKSKPYEARVKRGGKMVHLGSFPTAEEAALCVARSPEGHQAAKRPAVAVPLTSEEAVQQALAEGLVLLVAKNTTGYYSVNRNRPGQPKPYEARVKRDGKLVYLGQFATAEEAALRVARSPEGKAAAQRAAAAPPPIPYVASDEARLAQAEGLPPREANNTTGYFSLLLDTACKIKPFQAQMYRGGKKVSLGQFATAEEAALYVAREVQEVQELRAAATLAGHPSGYAQGLLDKNGAAHLAAAAALEQKHTVACDGEEGADCRPKKKARK